MAYKVKFNEAVHLSPDGSSVVKYGTERVYEARSAHEASVFRHMVERGKAVEATDAGERPTDGAKVSPPAERKAPKKAKG